MCYFKCLLASITLIAKVFTMEAPEGQRPNCSTESPVLSPLEEMPLKVLEQALTYLSSKDLLSSALACSKLAQGADKAMKEARENAVNLPEQGLNGIPWEPGNERQQIISYYSVGLFRGIDHSYHKRLAQGFSSLQLEQLYLIGKNASKFFKEGSTLEERLSMIEALALLKPEQIYIISKHALKVFTVQPPPKVYIFEVQVTAER